MSTLPDLLDDTDLAVLSEPADELVPGPSEGRFDAAQRDALRRLLIEDHRIDADLARSLVTVLAVVPAAHPWPDPPGVVALADSVAARFALDRSAAMCLAVAATRRLAWQGQRPVALSD